MLVVRCVRRQRLSVSHTVSHAASERERHRGRDPRPQAPHEPPPPHPPTTTTSEALMPLFTPQTPPCHTPRHAPPLGARRQPRARAGALRPRAARQSAPPRRQAPRPPRRGHASACGACKVGGPGAGRGGRGARGARERRRARACAVWMGCMADSTRTARMKSVTRGMSARPPPRQRDAACSRSLRRG